MKANILIFLISSFCFNLSLSQEKRENLNSYTAIFINLNDKAIGKYYISTDTTSASFSIYYKKYESKKERDKAIKIYNSRVKNIRTSGENPSEVVLPNFSISFLVFNEKPEKLKSLQGIDFITLKQFRDNNYVTSNPTYIIHKLKNGIYLRWLAITMDEI